VPTDEVRALDAQRAPCEPLLVEGVVCGPDEIAFGDYSPGQFVWVGADLHCLVAPCLGRLGLWPVVGETPRSDVERRLCEVERRLGMASRAGGSGG
jgi:hypothetical protein